LKKHNDKNIKDVIADFIRDNKKVTQGFNKARIGEIWKSEMGPVITSYTQKMTFHKGILKIYLTSAPLRKELHMGKDKIIGIINEHAGEEIVKELEFH
jgi:hypothetical protein